MRDRHGWIYFTILESPKNLICSAQEGDIPVINRKILLYGASLLEFEGPTDAAVWRHKHVSEVTFRKQSSTVSDRGEVVLLFLTLLTAVIG